MQLISLTTMTALKITEINVPLVSITARSSIYNSTALLFHPFILGYTVQSNSVICIAYHYSQSGYA